MTENPYSGMFPIMSDHEMRCRIKAMFDRHKPGKPRKGDEYIGKNAFVKRLSRNKMMSERELLRFMQGKPPYMRARYKEDRPSPSR